MGKQRFESEFGWNRGMGSAEARCTPKGRCLSRLSIFHFTRLPSGAPLPKVECPVTAPEPMPEA